MVIARCVGVIAIMCSIASGDVPGTSGTESSEGQTQVFHPNGTLRSTGPYRNGEKHGTFRYYDAAGTFTYQAYFDRGIEVWRSSVVAESPPADVLASFAAT